MGFKATLSTMLGRTPAATQEDELCFLPETGKCVRGKFLEYWLANGALRQQGYPISDAFDEVNPTDGKSYRVQYFERGRFEHHPEYAGTPYEELLGLLGREQFLARYPQGRPPGGQGDVCFDVTGRCVRGKFYEYWLANGELAQQGYPISDEFDEVSPTDGKTYRVQYFERARFEWHPEYAGTEYEVLLGLLGREQFLAKYPNGVPLFQDALADPVSGWPQEVGPDGSSIGYAQGGYRIHVPKPNRRATAGLELESSVTDARTEVDAMQLDGPDSSVFGLLCRVKDANNAYRFEIGGDGRYAIGKLKGGEWTPLTAPDASSAAIRRGKATNRIRADCVGDRLTLYVNGQRLAEVRDADFSTGDYAAIWAGTRDEPGAEVLFKNFVIYRS